MSEADFDLKALIPALKKLVKQYGISYDPETPVPESDAAADTLLHRPALDLVEQVGFYCKDTNRVIRFSRAEILAAVRQAPGVCRVGEGKDAGMFKMRRPDDPAIPWLHVGSGIVASHEEWMTSLIAAYAGIPEANSISISALDSLRGLPVMAGSPLELYAAIRSIKIGRRLCGRPAARGCCNNEPDLHFALGGDHPGCQRAEFGLRPSDGWLVGAISEMKIHFGAMNKTASAPVGTEYWGGVRADPRGGIVAVGGTALASTAYILMGLLVQRGNYQLTFPVHFRYGCSTPRNVLWAVSASCQAAAANIPMPVIWLGYMAAGPNTAMYFYKSAA